MNDAEDRVRRYLRSRADVPVPDDLRWRSAATDRRSRAAFSSPRWVALVAAVIAAVVGVGALTVGAPAPDGTGPRSIGPSPTASDGAISPVEASFPSSVLGMPVVSVAHAVDLLERGDLDGRAVAVAGYFSALLTIGGPPMRYISPLESEPVAFTDDATNAFSCAQGADGGTKCRAPTRTYLVPLLLREASGTQGPPTDNWPMPAVFIGHAGDARQWQCPADSVESARSLVTQEACRRAFVVDRIAWANGHELPLSANVASLRSVPRLTTDQTTAAVGVRGDEVLTAAPFRATDIATIDPRWNFAGNDIMWIVRSIQDGDSNANATRRVTVGLVDDATGNLIDSHDLALDSAYRPARLWTVATTHGDECHGGPRTLCPFYSVRSGDGTLLHDGGALGSVGPLGSVPGLPLVLNPGTYTVSAWLANDYGVVGSPQRECSTKIILSELDYLMLEADFPAGQRCKFGPPSPPKLTQ